MPADRYKIIKFRQRGASTAVRGKGNLTLEEAKSYCLLATRGKTWFCGFTKVK